MGPGSGNAPHGDIADGPGWSGRLQCGGDGPWSGRRYHAQRHQGQAARARAAWLRIRPGPRLLASGGEPPRAEICDVAAAVERLGESGAVQETPDRLRGSAPGRVLDEAPNWRCVIHV